MIKKEIRYTFFSDGTPHSFNPNKPVYVAGSKERRTQLDLHKELVKFRQSPTVFILDNKGKVVD